MVYTARAIIQRQNSVLLMERWRDNLHYFSVPGGHLEPGETPEQALLREVLEETTVHIQNERQVFELQDISTRHMIFLCNYISGEPFLPPESEEAQAAQTGNRFKPQWIDIAGVSKLSFGYWQPLQALLVEGLQHGFDDTVKVVTVAQAR